MRAYNFGGMGSNPTKLCHLTCREASMTTWVQFFFWGGGGASSLKMWEDKNVQKSRPLLGFIHGSGRTFLYTLLV